MKNSQEITFAWITSRGVPAMTFLSEQKARDWKDEQIVKWGTNLVETKLVRITKSIEVASI